MHERLARPVWWLSTFAWLAACGGGAVAARGDEPAASTSHDEDPPLDAMAYFRELEERLLRAQEIELEVDIENAPPQVPRALSVHADASELRWQATFVRGGSTSHASMVSDGTTARFSDDAAGDSEVPARLDLRELFAQGLARGSAIMAVGVTTAPDLVTLSDGGRCCWIAVVQAEAGAPETLDGARLLPLHARLERFGDPYDGTTLWIDLERRLPVRREIRRIEPDGSVTNVVELYRRFVVRP